MYWCSGKCISYSVRSFFLEVNFVLDNIPELVAECLQSDYYVHS